MKKSPTYEYIAQYVPDEFMDFTIKTSKIVWKEIKWFVKYTYEKVQYLFTDDYDKIKNHIKKYGLQGWTVQFDMREFDRDRDRFIFHNRELKASIDVHPKMPSDFIMNELRSQKFNAERYSPKHHNFMRWFSFYVKENIEAVMDKAGM